MDKLNGTGHGWSKAGPQKLGLERLFDASGLEVEVVLMDVLLRCCRTIRHSF